MKTTLENLFKGYANKDIKHNGYTDTWSVVINENLKTDTIMELVGAGYQFEVQPWGASTLRIIFN